MILLSRGAYRRRRMVVGIRFGKALLHAGRRRFIQQAKDHNPDAAEDKARNDFIQAQPAKLLPDDHGQGYVVFYSIMWKKILEFTISASAPLRGMREHITENRTTGPKAAPKPAQA